ncbi:serine hydrolase [Myxococcus stipitatus]|uniref:serine hydrolase domain-containing protein n=1 Tax=Myxococcus stipitatus TaxID=83455 RepID=UPI0030CC08E8
MTAYPRVRGGHNEFAEELQPAEVTDPVPLKQALEFLPAETPFAAFVALKGDRVLARWGQVDLPINTHSVRKSVLSGLYGIAVEKGLIRLDQTLNELGIDDAKVPLTETEKRATVRDLLMSRSGIYLEAAGEVQGMKDGRPQRGSHPPGTNFYYNNWDFNVLGVIFEKQTGMGIGQALHEWIARPLGMKTFRPEHVIYDQPSFSEHRQFIIFMSAEDLARFGALYAHGGRWQGRQIIPSGWIEESTRPLSAVKGPGPFDAYGYLWWVDKDDGVLWADGWGGQFMIVDAKNDVTVVSRNDTGRSLLQMGLFMALGQDGSRKDHQQLHHWMVQASAMHGL